VTTEFLSPDLSRDFSGRSALVAGGSTGIGLASARLIASRGGAVTIFSHDALANAAAVEQAQVDGLKIHAVTGDASDGAAVAQAVQQASQFGDGLQVLISSVAMHPYGDAQTTAEAVWDRTIAVNLKSAYLLAHYGLPHLLAARGGAIVNVASNQGSACQPNVSAYATTKGALLAFARTLAVDFGPQGVRANTVSPGPVATPMLQMAATRFRPQDTLGEAYQSFGQSVPLRRVAEPEEIAELIAFLAGPRGSYCNGADFIADGGLLASLGI
jgi:meso-butanediol dehydrogenase/(S,S)-butanediol dehydrogenase/diacetyl reductase